MPPAHPLLFLKLKTARKTLHRESTGVDCADCLREHDEAMSVCEGGGHEDVFNV